MALGALPAFAEADVFGLGAGRDKALTVQGNESRVINSYAAVVAPVNKGDREIRLDTLQGFDDGDLVMVLQMRDVGPVPASSFMAFTLPLFDESPVGKWEMARVEKAFGRTLTLTRPLRNDFAAPYTQVIRVPEFKSVTVHPMGEIKARNWDGSTGGVVAFLVDGTLHNNGVITASGAGFQQGWASESAESLTGCADLGGTCEPVSQDVLLRRLPMGGGGAIFFRAHALTGAGRIEAKGLAGEGAPGGGSISARLVERAECEVLSVQGAPSGSPWLSGAQGVIGGGTVLLQAGALEGCPVQEQDAQARASGESSGDMGAHVLMNHALSFPGEPVVTTPKDGARLKGPTPRVTGFGDPGASVILSLADAENPSLSETELPQTQVDETGAFSLVVPTPLADGTYQITAFAQHEGLASESSTPVFFTVDSLLKPKKPTILLPTANQELNSRRPTISGTAEDAVKVRVTQNGVDLGEAPVTGTTWSLEPNRDFNEGEVVVQAIGLDDAQEVGPSSDEHRFFVDLTAPRVPEMDTPDAGTELNDPTPFLAGTAAANSHVRITFVDGGLVGTATAGDNQRWQLDASTVALEHGPVTLYATASDDAGNTSDASSHSFIVDLEEPPPPNITTPAADASVNDPTPAFAGTTEPHHHVYLTYGGSEVGDTAADLNGEWRIEASKISFDGGVLTIQAIATDKAGNISIPRDHAFEVDTQAPAPPAIQSPGADAFLKESITAISGSAEEGAVVSVTLGGTELEDSARIGPDKKWSVSTGMSLGEALYSLKAVATDRAGNKSTPNEQSFTVDLTPPVAPGIETPVAGSIINNPRPPFAGTTSPDSHVSITFPDGGFVGSAIADGGGRWRFAAPDASFGHGPVELWARATDDAGHTSDASVHTFEVDLVPPSRSPTVDFPSENSFVNDSTPEFSGGADPLHHVTVTYLDGGVIGTATVFSDGGWKVENSISLDDGIITVQAYASDDAGNRSDAGSRSFSVDTVKPPQPRIGVPAEGSYISDQTPDFSGSAEPGTMVDLYFDGGRIGSTKAYPDGGWMMDSPGTFRDDLVRVEAISTDDAGNSSLLREHSFTVDTAPPPAPRITVPGGYWVNRADLTFEGTADQASRVRINIGSIHDAGAEVRDGKWFFTPETPLTGGDYRLEVYSLDKANNLGGPATADFRVDLIPPAIPEIEFPASGTIVGPGGTKFRVKTDGPNIVRIWFKSLSDINAPFVEKNDFDAGSAGSWETPVILSLDQGRFLVVATATDPANNTSAFPDAGIELEVDRTPPDAPTIQLADGGLFAITPNPDFTGTLPPGVAKVTLEITPPDAAAITASRELDGGTTRWSMQSPQALTEKSQAYKAKVRATDKAGNDSNWSPDLAFYVDLNPPETTITSPDAGSTIIEGAPIIRGVSEKASEIFLKVDGKLVEDKIITTDDNGNWEYPASVLGGGPHTLEAHAKDRAGREEQEPHKINFTINLVLPVIPTVTAPATNSYTKDPRPTLQGTLEKMCTTVTIYLNDVPYPSPAAIQGVKWTFAPKEDLANGEYKIQTKCKDSYNRESGLLTPPHIITVDRQAPGAPRIDDGFEGKTFGPDLQVITGRADKDTTITAELGGLEAGSTRTKEDGRWELNVKQLLDHGSLKFEVWATDKAGNQSVDSTSITLQMDLKKPKTVLTGVPEGLSTLPSVTFSMATDDATDFGVQFQCALGEDPLAPCSNPYTLRGLAEGPIRLRVKATDGAGNVEETETIREWEFKRPKTVEGGGVGCSSTAGAIPAALLWLAWAGWLRARRRQS
ncbi:Ig-like domain-containing protein [Myxococcus stipitatus]|uniref:Ig-like domain-containing protein n=1 Tax=Myxococcus stipitatus TaxID=83455 RepID=UPI0031452775